MRFRDWIVYAAGGAMLIAQTVDILAQSEHAITGETAISTSLAMSIVVWIVGALLTYTVVHSRVAVIETRQTDADRRLERIENKLDAVLNRSEHA